MWNSATIKMEEMSMKKIRFTVMLAALSILVIGNGALAMGGKQGQPDKISQQETAVTTRDSRQMVKEALDSMIEAYTGRNASKFMSFVSDDFTGDKTILDRAVRKDFSVFTNIDIHYSLNNVTADTTGNMLSASANFHGTHTVIKTGNLAKSEGTTTLVFKVVNNKALLYSMKAPLIFGVSDPAVATGK
jgi:hypothetical protein